MTLDLTKQNFKEWPAHRLKLWDKKLKEYGFFTKEEEKAIEALEKELRLRFLMGELHGQ